MAIKLSDADILVLNTYLNGVADLPVDVQAVNVRIRESLSQDNSSGEEEVVAAPKSAKKA